MGYAETWGTPKLRKIIATQYKTMKPENILIFHGAQEAIFDCMSIMLDEGDRMIAMFLNYQAAYDAAESISGCEVSKWYIKDNGEKRDWMADHYEKCVYLGVMSKSYGLAGLRVGWMACKDVELLEEARKFKYYLSICDSVPSEYLTGVALKHGDEIQAKNTKLIEENIKLADAFFKKYDYLFEPKPISCGPVAFHKLLIDMPVEELCQMAVDKKGVLLLPAEIYDMEGQYFRVGYGRKGVPEALKKNNKKAK